MSVQSAISLGLHTDDSTHFGVDRNVDEASRKNIWQSLFILDQIMAASLGRPKFIQNTKNLQLVPKDTSDILYSPRYRGSPAIRAVTRSCVFISAILERSYSGSCLLNGQFQEIARECLDWPTELDDKLRWQVEDDATAEEKSAILHVNLIYSKHSFSFLFSNTLYHDYVQMLTYDYSSICSSSFTPVIHQRVTPAYRKTTKFAVNT